MFRMFRLLDVNDTLGALANESCLDVVDMLRG